MEHLIPVILLVDDEEDIIEFLSYNLQKEGYKVYTAKNGIDGINLAIKVHPDIIVLDIMMPEMDGLKTCSKLRRIDSLKSTIIAILTAHGNDKLQTIAFDLGADDFIAKPIRPRLFICHINALLRRKHSLKTPKNLLTFKDLVIDSEAFMVIKNGKRINLTMKELDLLMFLVSKPGKVFNRKEIMLQVWGHDETFGDRSIDVYVKKLREKIGDLHIKTIKGIGYLFVV